MCLGLKQVGHYPSAIDCSENVLIKLLACQMSLLHLFPQLLFMLDLIVSTQKSFFSSSWRRAWNFWLLHLLRFLLDNDQMFIEQERSGSS